TLFTQTLIASRLTPEEFGIFSSSLALVMLLFPLIAIGSDGYWLKFSADRSLRQSDFNSNWVVFFIITLIPAIGLFYIVDNEESRILCLLMVSQSLINFNVAVFQSKKRYKSVSIMLALQSLSRLLLLLCSMFFLETISISTVIKLYVVVAVIMVIFCCVMLNVSEFGVLFFNRSRVDPVNCWGFIKKATPFGITTLLHLVYFQSDIIIINRFYSAEDAGLYSAAFMILTAAYMIPSVIYQKYFLPIAHQMASSGEGGKEYDFYLKGTKYIFMVSLFVTCIYYFLSEIIVYTIYGSEYSASSEYLKLLSFCIVFRFLSSNAGVFLTTENLIHKKNKYMLICAIFNVILNIIFIPRFGAVSAVISTVLTEIILCALFYRGVKRYKFQSICE
ncbi:oligosaccharide flippase family protein, partial [Vibrio parahaemolyticus]